MKTLYQNNLYLALSLIRMNRTARLHDGLFTNREECAEWALGANIENFQLRYKK